MIIDNKIIKYLSGELLSNGYRFYIGNHPVISRNKLLSKLSAEKKILHLGCADHTDLIEQKRRSGRYLHDILTRSAKSCTGIDINRDAIQMMKVLGMENVRHIDEIDKDERYDVCFIPDVIEHIPNVGLFLRELKALNVDEYVITTPNAFRLRNRLLFKTELVNTDHRYWFSPYTLTKCLYSEGFRVEKFYYTDDLSIWRPIQALLKLLYPLCRDGLAIVFKKQEY